MPVINYDIYDPYKVDFDKFSNKYVLFEEFTRKLRLLSDSMKVILWDTHTSSVIFSMHLEYGLNDQQSANLTRIIRDVLLCDLYIGDLPNLLKQNVGIDEKSAQEIASRIVSEIFKTALDDIKKIQVKKFADRIVSKKPFIPKNTTNPPSSQQKTPIAQGNVINLRKDT